MSKAILPHKVGNASIASPELKTVVMQFMENFLSLGGCVSDLQEVVRRLSNRRVVSSGADGEMFVNSFSFCEIGFANSNANRRRFYLSDFVADASKTYVVSVSFFWSTGYTHSSTSSYVCGIAVGGSSDTDAVLPLDTSGKPDKHKSVTVDRDNRRQACTVEISGSDSFFQLTNSNTTAVQITVKITPK